MNTYPNDDDDDDDDDEDDDVDDDEDDDVDEDEDEDEAEDDEDLRLLAAKLRDFDTEFIRGLKLPDLVELVRVEFRPLKLERRLKMWKALEKCHIEEEVPAAGGLIM